MNAFTFMGQTVTFRGQTFKFTTSIKVDPDATKNHVVDTTPIPVIKRNNMIVSEEVREQISDIARASLKYANSLHFRDVVRYKLAEQLINTHSDTEYYVNDNEKEGKKTFKQVVSSFCEKHNLGTISMGFQELIFNEKHVVGSATFIHYTDKTFGFSFVLDETLVEDFKECIKNRENCNNTPILSRLSLDGMGRMNENNILFNAPKINMPSNIMYPWFEFSPEELAQQFMDSTANVLVLYGDPGTGKTTFIKRMLMGVGFADNRSISVVDTPAVMQSPELVNNIYTSKHKDIFIFEDVDRHLYSREEGNDIMAGLLNAAEGLASPDVKIIISTNIKNLSDIDSALIRPGRCFKTLEFVKLNKEQQIDVREFLQMETDSCTDDEKSLAEVMNDTVTDGMSGSGFL
ncbi:hypothetical protein GAP32_510 [Cronobacter phage vB_CsaM_GAP32]|uniref:AAA+ ATPase domain-containing protein n=1 Tax=Cronobacter phage vB_CsaM_GAP32 TaxID=1141136 RepID=K4F9R5_9CAUD|nr:hypothetical protein GAP32_510 [Cronobacter phage vB_CsaM_GAP32]AFC21970.1 hypothetical protein GAP32_510 [Cronobacter phage vB_CsaM_GAP32]